MLIIIRGPSGSGKTTFAKERFYPTVPLVEADMYFIKDGTYEFNPERLKDAHEWCRNQVRKMLCDYGKCVVANTFTRHWEIQPYLDIAKEMNVEVEILRMTGAFQNVHGVPKSVVKAQRDRMEDVAGEKVIDTAIFG
jgi:predicted kinase